MSINNHSVSDILAALMPLIRTDGANKGPQMVNLQLFGVDKFEAFDMFFPILFPPKNGAYQLTVADINGENESVITVPAMSRKERVGLIKKRFPQAIPDLTAEDLWQFKQINSETALLTLHTFSIWNWDLDWKNFIQTVFDDLKDKNTSNLIIDIRQNGGGADMVSLEIMKHISQQDIIIPARKELGRFTKFPASVKPYLNT